MRKLLISLVFAALVLPTWQVSASPPPEPAASPLLTPAQMISGINGYRAANGLPPYQSNSTLMQLAQGQADYQASIETVTHTGPGGTRPIDRAYAIGYGNGNTVFVSEIIYGGYTATVDIAITWWKGSSIHNSTMLASTYQEIGAGVASSGDRMFFTAVTGYVVGAPAPENAGIPIIAGEDASSTENEVPQAPAIIIIPVTRAEPREDGSIVHTVRTGQALWNIAAVYDVPLEDLLEINNLPQNAIIFSGDEIMVQEATGPIVETELTTNDPTNTPEPTEAATPTTDAPEVAASLEEAAADEASTSTSALAALPAADQPTITGFFQGSTARWIVVIAFVGLLGVLGTSLVLQQRTVETTPATGKLDPLTTPLNVTLASEAKEEKRFEELPREEQFERLQRLGEVALMAYDLKVADIKPQKYWLNATFKLETAAGNPENSQSFLLRVHHPDLHNPAEVRSEMQWLNYLTSYKGIHTPEPIRNIEGKWVTMMDRTGVPDRRACTILRWQSGIPVTRQTLNPKQMQKIGTLLASLHKAGQAFKKPEGFVRPSWDLPGLQGKALNADREAVRSNMNQVQLDILDNVTAKVRAAVAKLDSGEDTFGIIHGDLQTQNLIFEDGEVKAIDFDASGWGYYVYDLAISQNKMDSRRDAASLEAALIKGYRSIRALPDQEIGHIKTLLAGRNMSQVYWLASRLNQPAFQKDTEKEIAQQFDYLEKFLSSAER